MILDNKANLRPESKQIIYTLKKKFNMEIFILSGDA